MILLIDNYDSFTYNLYQAIGQLYEDITVIRNDKLTIEQIQNMQPEAIIISPGPGYPKDAGISVAVIEKFSGTIPILGVCLGHQSIAQAFGGDVIHAKQLMHGKASTITVNNQCPVFKHLSDDITVARYHSLIVDENTLPSCLEITARDDTKQIMAIAHTSHPTYGVQFHPESILTKDGMQIIENFLYYVAKVKITPLHTEKNLLPPAQRNALKPYIFKIIEGTDLTEAEAYDAMDCIMNGGATDAQIGSFTTALRMKGETISELTGFAKVMRQKAATIENGTDAIDIVGTGGDMANTFNISTASCFTVAGAGFPVVKHGNYGATSVSGASNVMEQHGVKFTSNVDQLRRSMEKCNLAYLHAPLFNPALKAVAPVRKGLAVRTFFNMLGPLVNPVLPAYQLLGVYNLPLLRLYTYTYQESKTKFAVVHSLDGYDEISLTNEFKVATSDHEKIYAPESLGFSRYKETDLDGGQTPEDAAKIFDQIMNNTATEAQKNVVVVNSAFAIHVICPEKTIEECIALSKESLESGRALATLKKFIELNS